MQTNITNIEIENAIQDHWSLQLGSYFSSVHDLDGATYNLGTKVTDYYWNYAGKIKTTPVAQEPLIERVLKFAQEHDRQPAFYLDPSSSPVSFDQALVARGFAAEDEEVWMFYPMQRPISKKNPIKGLEIQVVKSDGQFADFLNIFHEAYQMLADGETSSPYGDSLLYARNNPPKGVSITHIIGYQEGVPVSIASTYQTKGTAGLYNVGTPEKYRRKGFGSALSNAAIQTAIDSNAKKLILQTGLNSEAHRLYENLGFTLGFTAVIWSQK